MQTTSMPGRTLAIALGCIASGLALYVLLRDDVAALRWSDAFVLSPGLLALTIGAGHMVSEAWRHRRPLAVLGFSLVFCIGTLMTVFVSITKQAGQTDTKIAETTASNFNRSVVEADLRDAETRYKQALDAADSHRSNGGCGRQCLDWSKRALEVEARIDKLKDDLKRTPASKPVAAGVEWFAQIVHALTGADAKAIRDKFMAFRLDALGLTFMFEVTAITAFGYRGPRVPRAPRPARALAPLPPPGDKRNPNIVSFVDEFERQHGRPPRIREVQQRFKVSKTSAHRYSRRRHGVA